MLSQNPCFEDLVPSRSHCWEMVEEERWLSSQTLAALAEDWTSIPSTHMVVQLQFQGTLF